MIYRYIDETFFTVYNCHAGWSENGTHYLITTPNSRSSAGAKRYCFIYTPGIGGTYHFSTSPVTCSRAVRPGITGALAFNITHQGTIFLPYYSPFDIYT